MRSSNNYSRIIVMKFIILFMLIAVEISSYSMAYGNSLLDEICNKSKCVSLKNEYKLEGVTISTDFYGPASNMATGETDTQYSNAIHRVSVVVKHGSKTTWEYNEVLEAHGDSVALTEGYKTPDKNKIIFHVRGNYLWKLIIVFSDGSVEMIDGSSGYTLENSGTLLFTPLMEDTPVGFQIYDLVNKQVVFKTDKFITSWSRINDGVYEVKEQLWEQGDGIYEKHLLILSSGGAALKE